ncbi:hypothetical protein GCM10007852_17860 [Agaribacter marinus]|uniref:Uncharacterized protein n=2 Tax=Agaribacter marinus TaxID=1431249 RepID=A0AA37WIC7_9ALTE|nr:hypothetical protein GCM10007852_17860 [Agaribacter marinus]
MSKGEIIKNKLIEEVSNQPRLQWLLLVVVIILLISVTKSYFDLVYNERENTQSEVRIHEKLLDVQSTDFSESTLTNNKELAYSLLNKLPSASSNSTAEASALATLEADLQGIIERSRFNLLGSEEIIVANEKLWSIRIEVNGRLPPKQLIKFFTLFETEKSNKRIASIQYSPTTANTAVIAVDFLYRERK